MWISHTPLAHYARLNYINPFDTLAWKMLDLEIIPERSLRCENCWEFVLGNKYFYLKKHSDFVRFKFAISLINKQRKKTIETESFSILDLIVDGIRCIELRQYCIWIDFFLYLNRTLSVYWDYCIIQENKIEKCIRLAAVHIHVVRAFFGVRIIIDGIAICVTFHPTTSQNALDKFIFNLFLN